VCVCVYVVCHVCVLCVFFVCVYVVCVVNVCCVCVLCVLYMCVIPSRTMGEEGTTAALHSRTQHWEARVSCPVQAQPADTPILSSPVSCGLCCPQAWWAAFGQLPTGLVGCDQG
jgi:hypothetical protein